MNCSQVQELIWCGDLQPDVHVHLATCEACREELQRVQEVNNEIEHTAIPLPTRSLLPAREEIEQAIGRNKKSRLTSWLTTSTVAAAILLAVTQIPPDKPATTTDNTGSTTNTELAALKAPASRSQADPLAAALTKGPITIDPSAAPSFRGETEGIRAFLEQKFDPASLQGVSIESYTRDTIQGDTQTGRLTLWVQNQPGQVSVYGKGDRPFRTQQYIELQKTAGRWTVTKLSDIPFDYTLHRQPAYRIALPSTWQVKPSGSTDGSLTFQQNGQTLGGVTLTQLRPYVADPLKAVQLPDNTTVIQSGLESYRTEDAVKYLLKRTAAATVNAQTPPEVHTYFLRGTVAYDVWLYTDTDLVPSETALAVTHSFRTAP